MDNQKFFELLFGKCSDSIISLTTLPDRTTRHYPVGEYPVGEIEKFTKDAVKLGAESNTYFSTWPRRSDVPDGVRGGSEDTQYATCLFADCDIAGPAHKAANLPSTKEEVLEFLKALEKPPTLIVDTGYGLDPFWIFKEPVLLTDDSDRNRINGILTGYGKFLIKEFRTRGWSLDNVFDPARMLRAPGSSNFKLDTPVPCHILWDSGIFYSPEEFEGYYNEPVADTDEPFVADDRTVGSAERIMEGCSAARKMLDDPNGVGEQLWHALCSNIALTPDGSEKFHDWSSPYNGYSTEETEYKIKRAQAAKKPCTCAYIRNCLGFECPEEGCGVRSPVVFSLLSKEEQIQNLLKKEKVTADEALEDYTLQLMAYAMKRCPADYSRFKFRVKKLGIGLRDYERAVRSKEERYEPVHFDMEPTEVVLDGLDLNGAFAPMGYTISLEDGVETIGYGDDGPESHMLCPEPLVITRRLENIDTGLEKVELTFYRNKKWKKLIAPRSNVFNKNAIVRYADSGLPVTTENAEGLVCYLSDYEVANSDVIPFTRSINRIGWIGREFYPCAVNGDIVYEDENKDGDGIVESIREHGDFDQWLKTAIVLRDEPFARAILAASFASPLLELLQNRVILLHLWHSSRSGKTAALKFALSIWGDPLKLMGNFNSTAVGMERRAGTLKHLPLGLDELQVLNEKRLSPALIVYSLGNGYGKTRGAKNGGLQDVPTWRNCVISTGEQPLTNENSMDGVSTRVLELYGQPIKDTDFGRTVHQVSESNYGFAGNQYIHFIIDKVLSHKVRLKQQYKAMCRELKENFALSGEPGVHLENIAVFALADYYASQCLFGLKAREAKEEAIQMGLTLLENAKSLEKEDTVERAWDFVNDWIAANRNRFSSESSPCYGKIEGSHIYILSTELRRALEDGGFSYTKCIKGFRERGYIAINTDSKGVQRTQHLKRIQGVNTRTICANIDITSSLPFEDDFLV